MYRESEREITTRLYYPGPDVAASGASRRRQAGAAANDNNNKIIMIIKNLVITTTTTIIVIIMIIIVIMEMKVNIKMMTTGRSCSSGPSAAEGVSRMALRLGCYTILLCYK